MEAQSAQAPPPAETPPPAEKPNGPVVAVMLAAGVGSFVMGLLTVWAEASEGFAESLQLDDGVGPLSGKTVFSVVAFLVAWGGLAAYLRNREVPWRTAIWAMAILVALGILGTFPIFFQEFAPAE